MVNFHRDGSNKYTVPAMKTQQNIGEFFTANLQGFERK